MATHGLFHMVLHALEQLQLYCPEGLIRRPGQLSKAKPQIAPRHNSSLVPCSECKSFEIVVQPRGSGIGLLRPPMPSARLCPSPPLTSPRWKPDKHVPPFPADTN
eukprot:15479660-Alexandrium_andersonii.AAC.1